MVKLNIIYPLVLIVVGNGFSMALVKNNYHILKFDYTFKDFTIFLLKT